MASAAATRRLASPARRSGDRTAVNRASAGRAAPDRAFPDRASVDCGEAGGARYRLAPGCQVRGERFGLLFYDLAGPRLLFAETGALLPPAFFREGGALLEALQGRTAAERRRTARLLDLLVKKGFLHEQPVR